MVDLMIDSRSEIILHFNKMHLQNQTIPMWVIKVKGNTHYVNHVDVEAGIGFSTKETVNNPHTKGSLKFKGKVEITTINNEIIARIFP